MDPATLSTAFVQEMDNNESVTAIAVVHFTTHAQTAAGAAANEPLLVVATARGLKFLPTECDGKTLSERVQGLNIYKASRS